MQHQIVCIYQRDGPCLMRGKT